MPEQIAGSHISQSTEEDAYSTTLIDRDSCVLTNSLHHHRQRQHYFCDLRRPQMGWLIAKKQTQSSS